MSVRLLEAIKLATSQEGFAGFQPSLENQLFRKGFEEDPVLYFRKDVSGGNCQAFFTCWVRCEKDLPCSSTEPQTQH